MLHWWAQNFQFGKTSGSVDGAGGTCMVTSHGGDLVGGGEEEMVAEGGWGV